MENSTETFCADLAQHVLAGQHDGSSVPRQLEEHVKLDGLIKACEELGIDASTLPVPGTNEEKSALPGATEPVGADLSKEEIAVLWAIIEPMWGRRWSDWVPLFNALLWAMRRGKGHRRAPDRYGKPDNRKQLLRRLARTDFWERLLVDLERVDSRSPSRITALVAIVRKEVGAARAMRLRMKWDQRPI
jgi:hypothetical protein